MIKFITYSESETLPESNIGGMGGFFKDGMRWQDYLDAWGPEVHSQLEELRTAIMNQHIRCTGSTHQSDFEATVPLFEDGTVAHFSFRGWGDLMAAVWSTEEDIDYCYMDYYYG